MSLLGEVFPHAYKAAGITVASSINWFFLFLVGMLFPLVVVRLLGQLHKHLLHTPSGLRSSCALLVFGQMFLRSFCFVIFLVFTAATAAFVWFHVPETNGLSALEIGEAFRKMHSKPKKAGEPLASGPTAGSTDRPPSQTKL